MAKLTNEMLDHIKSECERVKFGKITLCITDTNPVIDIVVEERKQFVKVNRPKPGQIVIKSYNKD